MTLEFDDVIQGYLAFTVIRAFFEEEKEKFVLDLELFNQINGMAKKRAFKLGKSDS